MVRSGQRMDTDLLRGCHVARRQPQFVDARRVGIKNAIGPKHHVMQDGATLAAGHK